MAENFGQVPPFDGGYDGVNGFWVKVYGVSVCDTSRMCFIMVYLATMCVGFYCWHVVTTGSFKLSTKGSVVDYLVGGDASSDQVAPAASAKPKKATPSRLPSRKDTGKRVASVGWSGGIKPADDDDDWVKME